MHGHFNEQLGAMGAFLLGLVLLWWREHGASRVVVPRRRARRRVTVVAAAAQTSVIPPRMHALPDASPAGLVLAASVLSAALASGATAVLVGLILNARLAWWWADPLAGYVILIYALKEGRAALRQD